MSRMSRHRTELVAAILAVAALASAADAVAGPARLDLQLERTPVIVRNAYRELPPIGKKGAMGANLSRGGFALSHQQYGDIYVRAGLIHGRRKLIKRGFRAFDYAFRRQRDNGSFPEDQAEGYAYFVEAVAHSVLLVRSSRYANRFDREMDRYVRRLRRASKHMIAPDAWGAFAGRNRSYTHTGYVMGTALAMTARLTREKRLERFGRDAVRMALDNQRPNGINPELGGYDVRYQMVGLSYAERFRVYFPDGGLKRRVVRMTNRGIKWMAPRVDSDGYINWNGSTRTCVELGSNGRPKSPGYTYAIRGFAYWGALQQRRGLIDEAERMHHYFTTHEGSICGPKRVGTVSAAEAGTSREAIVRDLIE